MMPRAIVGVSSLVAAWVFSIASYPRLPERVVIRWNFEFEPVGDASRFVAAVVIPSLLLLLPVLAWLLPRIDPRRGSYERHRPTYWLIWNASMVLVAVLQAMIVGTALGWAIDTARVFAIALGAFFMVAGNSLGRVRPNWFLGIRTPWTLSNDEVWRRTHRLAARMTVLSGALLVLAGLLPLEWLRSVTWVAVLVLAVLIPVAYSFVAWRRFRGANP